MARVYSRISPKTKERFRERIRDVIKGLSRSVIIYKQPLKSECPNCFYDKMTGTSTGKCKWTPVEALQKQQEWETSTGFDTIRYKYFVKGRCPVCKGQGYIETVRKAYADCLVIWNPAERYGNEITYTPAGTEGSTIVMLKTHPKYFDLFKNAEKIFVDGIECKISKPPILRGLGNQSVLIITAFTTEKPRLDSDEIIKDYS